MGFSTKKKSQEKKEEPEKFAEMEVKNVRDTDYGVFFSITINGVDINGCRVGETKNEEYFVSLPSRKGNDDKYYSIVYYKFSEAETEWILNQVKEKLEG